MGLFMQIRYAEKEKDEDNRVIYWQVSIYRSDECITQKEAGLQVCVLAEDKVGKGEIMGEQNLWAAADRPCP